MKEFDENGRLIKATKNGQTVYDDEKRVDRSKMSQESLKEYVNASNVEEKVDALFHLVTGRTVTEAENEVSS